MVDKQKTTKSAPEIRFTITKILNKLLMAISKKYGVDKSDYVRSLILNDLRSKENAKKT